MAVEVCCPPRRLARCSSIPPPLSLGAALLANKTAPKDFLVEAEGNQGAEHITGFGGCRGFLAARPPP